MDNVKSLIDFFIEAEKLKTTYRFSMCPEEAGRCGICNTGVVVCNIGQAGWVFSWRSSGSSCGVSKELWAYRNTLEQRLEGCGELVGVQSRISNRLKQAGMKWLSKRLHVSREGQLQSCEISSLRTLPSS